MNIKRYNMYKRDYIILEEWEVFCSVCGGRGLIIYKHPRTTKRRLLKCYKCFGYGKLDWIERATGKNLDNK